MPLGGQAHCFFSHLFTDSFKARQSLDIGCRSHAAKLFSAALGLFLNWV